MRTQRTTQLDITRWVLFIMWEVPVPVECLLSNRNAWSELSVPKAALKNGFNQSLMFLLKDTPYFIILINWYIFNNAHPRELTEPATRQIPFFLANQWATPLPTSSPPKVGWSDMMRENQIHTQFFCAWIMALILHKGALEPNKTKDGRHTSYMVYGALALPQLLQPEVTAMCDNKHRSLQKTFSCVALFFFFSHSV